MTQDEIIRIAREAGLGNERWTTDEQFHNFLERFAVLVAAHAKQEYIDSVYEQHRETMFSNKDLGMLVDAVKAEREACAKVCEDIIASVITKPMPLRDIVAAIRARSDQ